MGKWWSVCEDCGLGIPEDQPSVSIKDCKHPIWIFIKEEEDEE